MNPSGLRFLRPYLQKDVSAAKKSAYLRFFSSSRAVCHQRIPRKSGNVAAYGQPFNARTHITEFGTKIQERIDELKKVDALRWPRIESDNNTLRISEFLEKYDHLVSKQPSKDIVKINGVFIALVETRQLLMHFVGRLKGFRVAGTKLAFLDLVQDGVSAQVVVELNSLIDITGGDNNALKSFTHLIRRGDILCKNTQP